MKGKILFVTGLGLGYLLGTRAGRERYEEIKGFARRLWTDPRVQRGVDTVEDFVKEKAPEVAEFVSENAKKVASQVTSRKSSQTAGGRRGSAKDRAADEAAAGYTGGNE